MYFKLATKGDLLSLEEKVSQKILNLEEKILHIEEKISQKILAQEQRMTIKLGSMMAVGIGIIVALIKF